MTVSRATIARSRALRTAATPPERYVWTFLRTLRQEGHHVRRQAPFRGYVLDFVCYGLRLMVEVDGAHHGTQAQIGHDAVRDAVLTREGFRTLRSQATQVMENLEGVGIAIRAHLATPHPDPPHRGEGAPKAEANDFCSLPLVGWAGVGEHGA